jgi:hypothetical protein
VALEDTVKPAQKKVDKELELAWVNLVMVKLP